MTLKEGGIPKNIGVEEVRGEGLGPGESVGGDRYISNMASFLGTLWPF